MDRRGVVIARHIRPRAAQYCSTVVSTARCVRAGRRDMRRGGGQEESSRHRQERPRDHLRRSDMLYPPPHPPHSPRPQPPLTPPPSAAQL